MCRPFDRRFPLPPPKFNLTLRNDLPTVGSNANFEQRNPFDPNVEGEDNLAYLTDRSYLELVRLNAAGQHGEGVLQNRYDRFDTEIPASSRSASPVPRSRSPSPLPSPARAETSDRATLIDGVRARGGIVDGQEDGAAPAATQPTSTAAVDIALIRRLAISEDEWRSSGGQTSRSLPASAGLAIRPDSWSQAVGGRGRGRSHSVGVGRDRDLARVQGRDRMARLNNFHIGR